MAVLRVILWLLVGVVGSGIVGTAAWLAVRSLAARKEEEEPPAARTAVGLSGAAALGAGLGYEIWIISMTWYLVTRHQAAEWWPPGWLQYVAFPLLAVGLVVCYILWMRGSYYVTLKELRTYFTSPIAYVVMMAVFAISGLLFWWTVKAYMRQEAQDVGGSFMTTAFLLLLISPLLTMRLFAEEKRAGTYEMLMTHPVRDLQVVIGKFVAAASVMLVMLAVLFVEPVILEVGSKGQLDWGPIWSSYAGLIGWACAFAAIGVFTSALTNSQIAAAAMAWFTLLMLWLLGALRMVDPGKTLSKIGEYMSVSGVMEGFSQGNIDTTALIYLGSVTVFFLFAATMVLFANRSR
jgi:gliding motility-associated transport system permease protein